MLGFCTYQQWLDNEALYADLARGQGPDQLKAQEIIPMIHGDPLSLRQLLVLVQDRGQLWWDESPSPESEALRRQGHSLLQWDGQTQWLGKLLAHISDRFPVRHVPIHRLKPQPVAATAATTQILDVVLRILGRAGLPQLPVAACPMPPFLPNFVIQTEELVDLTPFYKADDHLSLPGTLLVNQRIIDHQAQRPDLFDLMKELLAWGDPHHKYLDAVWHACAVEISWAGLDA